MLKFTLILYPIVYFICYICRYIYILEESYSNFISLAKKYDDEIVYLTFDNFKNFFHLNSQKWKIYKRIFYDTKKGERLTICFNFKDYLRVFNYLSEIKQKKANSFDIKKEKNLELLLKDVQSDIDDIKKQSEKECEEAIKDTAKIMGNIKLELSGEDGDEDDTFMYEQQTISRKN